MTEFQRYLDLRPGPVAFFTFAISSDDIRKFFFRFNSITDLLTEVGDSLNTCCTGVCLFAMTVERYIYICHPTKVEILLNKSKHIILCLLSTAAILIGSVQNFFWQVGYKNASCEDFLFHNMLKAWRAVDAAIFFVMPALCCVVFFIRMASTLKNMLTHQERNQQLIKALAVIYFSWIILWIPREVFDIVLIFDNSSLFISLEQRYRFWKNLMDSLGMLYSTVTPLSFIILIRAFQDPIKKVVDRIKGRAAQHKWLNIFLHIRFEISTFSFMNHSHVYLKSSDLLKISSFYLKLPP